MRFSYSFIICSNTSIHSVVNSSERVVNRSLLSSKIHISFLFVQAPPWVFKVVIEATESGSSSLFSSSFINFSLTSGEGEKVVDLVDFSGEKNGFFCTFSKCIIAELILFFSGLKHFSYSAERKKSRKSYFKQISN